MERLSAPERTREELRALMNGDLGTAAGRGDLVRLALRLIVEEALEGEVADVLAGHPSLSRCPDRLRRRADRQHQRRDVEPGELRQARPARNLQITFSANPGPAATHRFPQTFDLLPSGTLSPNAGALLDYPDELIIDWARLRT
jgi:hypothetical protein